MLVRGDPIGDDQLRSALDVRSPSIGDRPPIDRFQLARRDDDRDEIVDVDVPELVDAQKMNENISRAAGATHGQGLEPHDFATIVAPLGRPLAQRNTVYGHLTADR